MPKSSARGSPPSPSSLGVSYYLAALALEPRRIVLRSDQPAGQSLKIEVIP
jgi:hypothetical protein